MKKFFKFIFGTLSLATLAAGVYYLYKNIINKDSSDEFEDFEDEFEDFDSDEEDSTEPIKKDGREYVSINLTNDANKKEADNTISTDEPTTSTEKSTSTEEQTSIGDEEIDE